jgi:ATP-dependent Lon protease
MKSLRLSSGEKYPVLPLRDIVVFPHMIVPLFVGRERSVQTLEEVMQTEKKYIILATQKNPTNDSPEPKDLYSFGTIGSVLQLLKLPDGTVKILVEGVQRVKIVSYVEDSSYLQAVGEIVLETEKDTEELEALQRSVLSQFENYVKLNRKIPPEVLVTVNQIDDSAKLADTIASYLTLKIFQKQEILEISDINKRLEKVLSFIESETTIMQVEKRIRTRVKKQMEKTQKEYYLNEQMKAIHKELGGGEDGKDEITDLEEKIQKIKLSKEAKEKALQEVKKLRLMNQSSAESTVVRNYLEWLISIPWQKPTKVKYDLKEAEEVLNKDHFGITKVKERILEYLAVQSRVKKVRGQIICLVGPPGVGKTSLGKSIANATGRNFVRISLGGVKDESEIRGHRRTYIGSMPGKIIQGMKKAKSSNPLFLLDEIDKLGNDWRGDPSSALLEVLDPEQNTSFNDHYLEVDYDLSDVMFITTANTLNMPQPLLDRMEIIRISGYTEDEKLAICKNYLIPKQMELHGLKKGEFNIDDDFIYKIIRYYTKEAGVRNLEREIAKLCRKSLKNIVTNGSKGKKVVHINDELLEKFSGVRKYNYGLAESSDVVGVVTGLAWTEFGGDLLAVEVAILNGKGKTLLTGKLGDVMQESIQAAISYVRSKADHFGITSDFEKIDIHVHVPEGAIPKDGPSAGIAMCTAIVSALKNIPISKDVAMTGEITLRGNVLQIGGLKEKLLAAHRGGIKKVLIPEANAKDLVEIPDNIKKEIEIIPVKHIDEVLKVALA